MQQGREKKTTLNRDWHEKLSVPGDIFRSRRRYFAVF